MGAPNRKERTITVETVRIEALSHDGRGVARIDGKTVFVSDALPGETARVRRRRRRRRHDEAELVEVLEASPHRVEPRCPYYGTCGGCALQHLAPEQQVLAKQASLLENLERVGRVAPRRVLEPLTAEVWRYRRRARLAARYVHGKGRVLVGFRERHKPYVADMASCEVLAAPADRLVEPLARLIGGLSVARQVPQIEVAVGDEVTALVFRLLAPASSEDLVRLRAFALEQGVQIYLQPGGAETVAEVDGREVLPSYQLGDLTLEFAPTDFIQVNGALNARMVARAVELLSPGSTDVVLDLFCGIGNFTLPLARRAGRVTGLEGDAVLVERARRNAARNGIENVSLHVADLSGDVSPFAWASERFDLLLLDPPRTGAREILSRVEYWQPRRIVCISCHPGTLARDAGLLVHRHGYRLEAAGVMDMFPHTTHVESICSFEAP